MFEFLFSEVFNVSIFYPNAACLQMASELKTALAACKCRLFQPTTTGGDPFNPSVSTTLAELVAAEATFDGYAAGGLAVPAFGSPFLDPAGGAAIQSPVIQFNFVKGSSNLTNVIGGFWIEDATGKLRVIGTFPQPVPMQGNGQSIPLTVKLIEPTGQ